ncbi:MAG: hypothetical protein ABFC80_03115 [Coriobacteriales bacterium]
MDCARAQEIINAAFDGPVDAQDLADAREHARTCPECDDLLRALDAFAVARPPRAPAELVERLVDIGAREAEHIRRRAAESELSDSHGRPSATEGRTRPLHWSRRFSAIAAVAAVLVTALAVAGLGMSGVFRGGTTATDTESRVQPADQPPLSFGAGESKGGAPESSAQADVAAPPLVVFESGVYRLAGPVAAEPEASALTTAGSVTSALDSADASPTALIAYRRAGDRRTLLVQTAEGELLAFEPVIRMFGGREYQLRSGAPIERFGLWPSLPARYPAPASQDGSPTFAYFGKDDAGVAVFIPHNAVSAAEGFAVAPGTEADDPAAGAPVWTWWEPLG